MQNETKSFTESLSYVRKADQRTKPSKGFVYINRWKTGAQHLIFASHEDAEKFAANRNAEFTSPTIY
jgi:hypothetical protein